MPNHLIHESSPYLLQHAHNPVEWMPYGDEAFALAKSLNRPLIISIGYSSCHWCHVMEHESFENEQTAKLMNEWFVCVKVDREERPDVDHVYMDAVQQLHGHGGWPLNCFALPDGRPFWGGTYFQPEAWKSILEQIHELYTHQYTDLEAQAEAITNGVQQQTHLFSNTENTEDKLLDISKLQNVFLSQFDTEKGGLKGAPKFPMPVALHLLFDIYVQNQNNEALQLAETTLQHMARGGIFDQAGGGFARYSTDADWKVPHFEKMLYDNAQLASVYARAFHLTNNGFYAEILERTLQFVERELTSPEGLFYCALDADSQGEEGQFYTFTYDEFEKALGHYSALMGEYFGIEKGGNWEKGKNILLRTAHDALFAQQHYLSLNELHSLFTFCCNELLKLRNERSRPLLDDKSLLAWNALMVQGLLEAHIALPEKGYLHKALTVALAIEKEFTRSEGGLYHTWKKGKAQITAFLDDYAFWCEALIKLHELTADEKWLLQAKTYADYVVTHFSEPKTGFFFYSENSGNQVFANKIEVQDGIMPSGNAAMAEVLYNLGVLFEDAAYKQKATEMLRALRARIQRYPAAFARWASLGMQLQQPQTVVAITGENASALALELLKNYSGEIHICASKTESILPYQQNRFVQSKTLIYICKNNYCLAPVESVSEAINLIKNG